MTPGTFLRLLIVEIGVLPSRSDDGAKLRADRGDHAIRRGICRRQDPVSQDVQTVYIVLGAAQPAAPLRLRSPGKTNYYSSARFEHRDDAL